MKKILSVLAIVSVLFFTGLFTDTASAAAPKTKLDKKSITMYAGEMSFVVLLNASEDFEWTVSKEGIVEFVSTGETLVVKGLKAGKTYVKAEYNGKTYKCKVIINEKPKDYVEMTYGIKIYDITILDYIEREGLYIGKVKNGVPHGEGEMYILSSVGYYCVNGKFKNGKLSGTYYIKYLSGDIDGYEEYKCKDEKFISTKRYYNDSFFTDEFYVRGKIIYHLQDECMLFHNRAEDDSEEPVFVADYILYEQEILGEGFEGYGMDANTAINIDEITRLSKSKIRKKAAYIEPQTLKDKIGKLSKKVDYIEEACVLSCTELEIDEDWGFNGLSEVCITYDDHEYNILFEGKLNYKEGDIIKCYFTPYCNATYKTDGGDTDMVTFCVGYLSENNNK